MKGNSMRIIFLLGALLVLSVGGFFIYSKNSSSLGSRFSLSRNKFPAIFHHKSIPHADDHFTGSDYKGNYVWGGAMNLAWNELSEDIIKDIIQFRSQDENLQNLATRFNSKFFTKNDLDEKSYYIKSGFGQNTVDLINKESKQKFPTKSFLDLSLKLQPEDAIAYAYFLKEVKYPFEFKERNMKFKGHLVDAFYADGIYQSSNVQIIKYWNDDKFILTLRLQDNQDQLILAKGFDMSTPFDAVNELKKYPIDQAETMDKDDVFKMPKLHLDLNRTYSELEDQWLVNKINGQDAKISKMFENIKFDLDHKGARVENEAVISVEVGFGPGSYKHKQVKYLLLDQPFWVIMKRTPSQNPYFTLGVNNEALMSLP